MRTCVRTRMKGGTCCFIANLAQRNGNSLLVEHIGVLEEAFLRTRHDHPFAMRAR